MKTPRFWVWIASALAGAFSLPAMAADCVVYLPYEASWNPAAHSCSAPWTWNGPCQSPMVAPAGFTDLVCKSANFSGGSYSERLYVFQATAPGCPSGYTSEGGVCVPSAPGPSPGRQAAEDAARAAAEGAGFDQSAQDAAAAAAGAAYDEWKAAGKSDADAAAAAAGAGYYGAVEDITGRVAGAVSAANAAYSACAAAAPAGAGGGCWSHFAAVDAQLLGMGFDVNNPPLLCMGDCSGSPGAKYVEYRANRDGSWDAWGNSAGMLYLGGDVETINFSPNATGSTVYGATQPSAAQAVQSEGRFSGGKTIVQTADGGGALVVTRPDGATEVYYFDDQTHLEEARAVVANNGVTTCTGDCAGKTPINDVVAAGAGGRGPSVAVLNNPGAQAAQDAVTGQGAGAGSLDGINGEKSAFGSALDGLKDAITGAKDTPMPDSGWSWLPTFSPPVCEPWNIPVMGRSPVTINPCPAAEMVRDLGAYALYFFTMIGLYSILMGKPKEA